MTNDLLVKKVETGKDIDQFIKFPWKIYKKDPNWVPPLINDRKTFFNKEVNPFFSHADVELFIAYKGSEPVGTIGAAVNHQHNKVHNDSVGFFGFFECCNDYAAAARLLDTAAAWLASNGKTVLRGPMNFSVHDSCGLLIDDFNAPPVFLMPYNPAYYMEFLENYGFKKATDLFAYKFDLNHSMPDQVLKAAEKVIADNPGIKIRNIDMSRYDDEMLFIRKQYDKAMTKNWGYLPFTDDGFDYISKGIKQIIDPDLTFFIEIDNKVAGYSLTVPDFNIVFKKLNGSLGLMGTIKYLLNKNKINVGRNWALGVVPEFHDQKIGALLSVETVNAVMKKGYRMTEASWINEENKPMNRIVQWLGYEKYKTYRVFDRPIT
ncbi:MAG: hypothetical protein GY754_14335 [bacterium]|nr:hypothetical protein [bacterium]